MVEVKKKKRQIEYSVQLLDWTRKNSYGQTVDLGSQVGFWVAQNPGHDRYGLHSSLPFVLLTIFSTIFNP